MERNGLEENTLVLFTSDNGGAGYIGLPDVNQPVPRLEDHAVRRRHPRAVLRQVAGANSGRHRTFEAPVHHFDMYATAAAAAEAPLPGDRKMDGVDLLPFVTGAAEGVPHRSLFWRSGASQSALVDGWKLDVSDPPGRRWLFDLESDPYERNDLSSERPDKLAELEAALAAHNAEQAPPAWPAQISTAINLDKDLSRPDAPDDEYIYWSN